MRSALFRSRCLFGLVSIALILMSGMIQAAHFHASGQADHDCALCLAAHSVARVAPPIALQFSSRTVASLTQTRSIAMPRRAVFFRLAIRPPPVALAFSA